MYEGLRKGSMEKAHRRLSTTQNLSPSGQIQGMEKRAWQNTVMHISFVEETMLAVLLNQEEATKSNKNKSHRKSKSILSAC
jgi:hypothetical protein